MLAAARIALGVAAILAAAQAGSGCRPPQSSSSLHAVAFSAGDRLFRGDTRWLGGDAAYSVGIDARRRLWLFGDSFIGLDETRSRSRSKMVRNSVGLQIGQDVRTATMRFSWSGSRTQPKAFFAGRGDRWYWPGPAANLGRSKLLLSLVEMEKSGSGSLGFRAVASTARLVTPTAASDPHDWSTVTVSLPENAWGVLLGTGSLLVEGEYLYSYAVIEPGDHDVYLARWKLAAARRGQLSDPAWWDGERYRPQAALVAAGDRPGAVARDAQTELSVHRDASAGGYLMVHTLGFGSTSIGVRRAPHPQGPWSEPQQIYRPPQSDRAHVLVYAAKAHAGLTDPTGAVLLTYATNHEDFAQLVADSSLYYPSFVSLHSGASAGH